MPNWLLLHKLQFCCPLHSLQKLLEHPKHFKGSTKKQLHIGQINLFKLILLLPPAKHSILNLIIFLFVFIVFSLLLLIKLLLLLILLSSS